MPVPRNFFHRDVDGYDSDDISAIVLGYDDDRIAVLNATNGAVPGRWEKLWQIVAERMTGRFTGWNAAQLVHTGAQRGDAQRADRYTDRCVRSAACRRDGCNRDKHAPRVPLAEGAATLRIVLAAQLPRSRPARFA